MFGVFGLGGVLAATTITLNQGSPIALGAGYTTSTACDSSITINTQNQFINNKFMVSTISLSNIDATYPNGCGSSVLDLSLVVNGSLVNTSFSIASSASNNNYLFGGTAGTGFFANTVLTPFDISQLTSVALSAYKVSVVGYAVGDTGPGGGTVFYVSATPFTCGPTLNLTCTYLEAAPSRWNAGAGEPARSWANATYQSATVNNATSPETATATAIGWGYRNTQAIILQGNTGTATSAAALANSYTVTVSGVAYDDWYLPSKNELNQMCKWQRGITGAALTTLTTVCIGGILNSGTGAAGFVGDIYWSSSDNNTGYAWTQTFHEFGTQANDGSKNLTNYVRPVRAF